MIDFLYVFLITTLSSSLGALLGIGGGILMVPLFVLFLGIEIQKAVAISLFTIIGMSMLVSSKHIKSGALNLPLGFTLELSTALGAILGSFVALNINHRILSLLFSVFLLFVVYLMLKGKGGEGGVPGGGRYSYFDEKLKKKVSYDIENLHVAYPVSFIAGVSSGMFGIGGGVLKVPILAKVCRLPMKVATATSSFMIGITASASAYVYFRHGNLNPLFAFVSLLGALIGSRIGIYFHARVKNEDLKKIFAFVLLLIALDMFLRSV